MDRESELM
jgi:hypothetical protein